MKSRSHSCAGSTSISARVARMTRPPARRDGESRNPARSSTSAAGVLPASPGDGSLISIITCRTTPFAKWSAPLASTSGSAPSASITWKATRATGLVQVKARANVVPEVGRITHIRQRLRVHVFDGAAFSRPPRENGSPAAKPSPRPDKRRERSRVEAKIPDITQASPGRARLGNPHDRAGSQKTTSEFAYSATLA